MNQYNSIKKPKAPLSLLPLKLIETDHGRCSLETAVCTFQRSKCQLLLFAKRWKITFKKVGFCRKFHCINESLEMFFSKIFPSSQGPAFLGAIFFACSQFIKRLYLSHGEVVISLVWVALLLLTTISRFLKKSITKDINLIKQHMIFSFPQLKRHEKHVLLQNSSKNHSYVKDTNKLKFIWQS